jgi:hypothetical protein
MSTTDRPQQITVCLDTTLGAHHTDSDEIGWWLPVIGPTATILAYTFARQTATNGSIWDTSTLAQRVGLAGNRSRLWASLDRLEMFSLAHFHATDILTIRTELPALTERQAERLPADLAARYPHLPPRQAA